MAKIQLRHTRTFVWLFTILMLIVPLLIGVGLALRLDSSDFQDSIITAVASQMPPALHGEIDPQPVKALLHKIQIPLLSLLLCIFCGSALALLFFYRYMVRPLDQMTLTARQIIEGNLDLSIPENRCHEVNELGRSFNDLSINLQEIILLMWNYLRDSSVVLDRLIQKESVQKCEENSPTMRQDLVTIREEMKTMEQVITSFDLYDVHIVDQRALAGSNTWQGGITKPPEQRGAQEERG